MAENGYLTAGFTTSPLLSRAYGYDRGFRHWSELIPHETDPALRRLKGGERLLRHSLTHAVSGLLGQNLRPARLYVAADDLTGDVCDWIDQADGPYFIWAHYMDVHWPYHLEEKLISPGDRAQAWRDLGHLHRVNRMGHRMSAEQKARYTRLYEEAVQYTDGQLGRLFDHLRRTGQLDNTIVVLVSDHGEEFLERRHWGHFEVNLYDEIARVPLIMHLPGEPGGQVVERQVSLLDIMPTLLALTDCPAPPDMAGESLAPIWRPAAGRYERELAICEMWRDHWHIIALRTEQHKYIWDSQAPGSPRLFDLQADPGERINLAADAPALAATFQAQVDAHLAQGQATAPTKANEAPERDAALMQRLYDLGYAE